MKLFLSPSLGPITNAFITLAPANMINPDSKPSVPLPKFSRHLYNTESMERSASEGLTVCLGLHQKVQKLKCGSGAFLNRVVLCRDGDFHSRFSREEGAAIG